MNKREMTQLYRELDRDCALFSREIGCRGEGNYELREPFMPDERQAEEAWRRLEDLRRRVRELPAPDRVFSLVRHHLEDFLDGMRFTLEDRVHRPEKYYMGVDGMIQMISRCSRQPDEERLAQILSRMESLERRRTEVESRLTLLRRGILPAITMG